MNRLHTIITGFCMGIADLIPGVSGGTIAFISGLYERLIAAVSNINICFFKFFFTGRRKSARVHIDGTFLVGLFSGILLAIILGSGVISWALEQHSIVVMMFFVGLIIASIVALLKEHPFDNWQLVCFFIGGLIGGTVLTSVLNITVPGGVLGLFIAGIAGSTAMLLPGISGSYILLILGAYERVISHIDGFVDGLKSFNLEAMGFHLGPIAAIGVGVLLGIVLMSNALKRLLSKWHDEIILFLIGIMTGSLPALIPHTGEIAQVLLPSIVFFVLGLGLMWLFFWAKWRKQGR